MPGVAFPPVGPVGRGFPLSQVLCSAKTATLSVSKHFACRLRPATLCASVGSCCPLRARPLVEAPRSRQGFWAPGPPFRACDKETRGSPKFPSYPYACMPRSETPVGPLHSPTRVGDYCLPAHANRRLPTTLHMSGLHHAACILAPSSSVRPLLGVHVEVAPDPLARLSSGRTCTVECSPPG